MHANQNPPTQRKLRVTPSQLAALTLIEVIEHHLATAADRLLTIEQADAGHALGETFKLLQARKAELVEKWSRSVQLVDSMPAIPSKVG
jgi:hypothetical protein